MLCRSLGQFSMLLCTLLILGSNANAADHTTDDLATVKKNLKADKAVIIDVRELDEWQDGHLAEATFLPLTKIRENPAAADVTKTLPKDRIIYIHCRSGGRCRVAADLLSKGGWDLRPLKPGFEDLKAAGFKTVTPK